MSQSERVGVLLMAYGTPETIDQVEPYFTDVRGGRKPSPQQLSRLVERYRAIGGRSPLLEITRRQVAGLQQLLDTKADLGVYRVHLGMRHWQPRISTAVEQIVREGASRLVTIALAPHYSRLSVGAYNAAVHEAVQQCGDRIAIQTVDSWHDQPLFLELMADRVKEGLGLLASDSASVHVCFTAHSLPQRILEWADPYPTELLHSSQLVAEACGLSQWSLAFQSASSTGEAWLGPSVEDRLRELANQAVKAVLIVPIGFVTDHLEILYDLDIECMALARELGIELGRTRSLNDAPGLIAALSALVRDRVEQTT